MHAHALEEMYPYLEKSQSNTLSILDVGSGSGYLTAALGRWVDDSKHKPILGKPGTVYGIDVFPELVEMTRKNMQKQDGDLLENGVVEIAEKTAGRDGRKRHPLMRSMSEPPLTRFLRVS